VKEPLKLPFVYLFLLLCVTVILAALDLFASWGLSDSAAVPLGLTYVLQHFPGSAFDVIIPSVVVSMILIGFRMAHRPFSRLLGFLIVLLAGYIVLVNGMIWLSALSGRTRQAPLTAGQYLQPRTFVRLGAAVLAPAAVAGDNLEGILLDESGHLTVYPTGRASSRDGSLTITLPGGRQITGSPQVSRSTVFAPDIVSALFLRDINTLTNDFQRMMANALPEFFAACFALVFLCAASLALLRLTRWPLANVMLLLIAARAYFLLYHVLATRLAAAVSGAVTDPGLARLFPSASFVVLGIILLLVDIIFIPARRWTDAA
jgi:hypothetical protein